MKKCSIRTLFIICAMVLVLRGFGYAACPNWVPITGTQYSMVAYGEVFLDGTKIESPGWTLAAFGPGGASDCRAVNDVSDLGSGYIGYLTIVGNSNGETISFMLCDGSTDEVYDVTEEVTFADGGTASTTFNATTTCTTNLDCCNGLYCDGEETCDVNGVCQPGTDPCPGQVCVEATDECVDCLADADCDNGDYCDGAETCVGGSCQAGTSPCPGQLCDEGTDTCVDCLVDADCANANYCDGAETCVGGSCQAGTDPCPGQICIEATDECVDCLVDADCADTNWCNGDETCDNGSCVAGTDPCPGQVCVEATDECVDCTEAADCDNGVYCDGAETCDGGTCQDGTNPCPDLLCDEATDECVECFVDGNCDNGLFCDGAETCDGGNCQDGTNPCPDQLCDEGNDRCVDCLEDADCDDGDICTDDSCDLGTGLCSNLPDFDNVLYATGQEYDGNSQIVEVTFGLDSGAGTATPDPNNWSRDNIVRLQLIIDEDAVIADPNNIDPADLLVVDVRPSESLEQPVAWYVMVDNAADPNEDDYYPELSWDLSDFMCTEIDGNACVYELRGGLSTSGAVLVADMTDANSYQTVSEDGDPVQYFTILMTCVSEPEEPEPVTKAPTGPIFPWPGIYPRGLGWGGLPFSLGFQGGVPYRMSSGYAPGLSIPSFPGTYTGFAYPGGYSPWTSYAWTSYVPRYPSTFPTLGIFSPVGRFGWPYNYWSGFPSASTYRPGWFYTYR